MTNHHIAADCVQKLSSQETTIQAEDSLWQAATRRGGARPGTELLTAIEDVTQQVNQDVRPEMSAPSIRCPTHGYVRFGKECAAATGSAL